MKRRYSGAARTERARTPRGTARSPRQRRPNRSRRLLLILITTALALALLCAGVNLLQRAARQWVAGLMPVALRTPDIAALGPAPVQGPPSIEVRKIEAVLRDYGSPATGDAQAFYDLGLAYGIDPAYCLAFFIVESRAGTRGVATTTRSVGNIRARPGEPSFEGYRLYATWREGIEGWYRLIAELYIGEWGLTTIDAIVPVYAPRFDNNDPDAYARSVKLLVARWRGF